MNPIENDDKARELNRPPATLPGDRIKAPTWMLLMETAVLSLALALVGILLFG